MKNKIKSFLKVFFYNFLFLVVFIFIIELFFGHWFKNSLQNKLASERNVYKVYKTDFKYLKNTSLYIKNNFGLRVETIRDNIEFPDIVFIGGSTINQKFLNYNETVVGIVKKNFNKLKIINAGVDGMSIKGNLNSFELWFDKIKNFNPKYYIVTLGVNDRYMIETFKFRDFIDNLEEASHKDNLREYIQSNSFFITNGRVLKSALYLKYGIDFNIKKVKKNHVYVERNRNEFISFIEIENKYKELDNVEKLKYENFSKWYFIKLDELAKKITMRKSIPIYITQTTGYGHSYKSYIIAKTIIDYCEMTKIYCIDVAKKVNFEFDDFYDKSHLNIKGTKKMASFLINELKNL